MKKVRLNNRLISTLNSVLFIPVTELCKATGIAKSTWYDIKGKPDAMTIQYLLAVANGLHIPVRRFFSSGREDVIGKRDEYVTEPYINCHYDGSILQSIINTRQDATWQKAAKAADMSYQNLQKSLLTETRLPVNRLLAVCEEFQIDPFSILVDPNPEAKRNGRRGGAATLLADIGILMRKVEEVTGKYNELSDKYDDLLRAHRELLKRFDGHDNTIGIAAEPLEPEGQDKK